MVDSRRRDRKRLLAQQRLLEDGPQLPPFSWTGRPCTILADLFALFHALMAAGFGGTALVYPEAFSLFVNKKEDAFKNDSVPGDVIRWVATFILGFAAFAFSSLWMDAWERYQMARCFGLVFVAQIGIVTYIQTQNRWTGYQGVNILSFAVLAFGYSMFMFFPEAFDRRRSKLHINLQSAAGGATSGSD